MKENLAEMSLVYLYTECSGVDLRKPVSYFKRNKSDGLHKGQFFSHCEPDKFILLNVKSNRKIRGRNRKKIKSVSLWMTHL